MSRQETEERRPRHGRAFAEFLHFVWFRNDAATRVRIVLSILLIGATAGLQTLAPLVFATAVDALSEDVPVGVALPVALLVGYGLVFTLSRALVEVRYIAMFPVVNRVLHNLTRVSFAHVHSLGLEFHLSRRTGQLAEIIGRSRGAVSTIVSNALMSVLPLVGEFVIVAGVLLYRFDPAYTVVILVTFVLYGIALIVGAEKHGAMQREAILRHNKIMGRTFDNLFNYETVKYFGTERMVARDLDEALRDYEAFQLRTTWWRTITGIITVVIMGGGLTLMIWMAGRQTVADEMTVGGLVLVNAYLLQVVLPLDRVAQIYRDTKLALIDMEKLIDLLHQAPDMVDDVSATPLPDGPGGIEFRDVSFAYDARRPILDGISFEVPPGTTTALVGPTGAGKSTIARLLFRFYNPTGGAVRIDGHNTREHTVETVRAAIGVVPQDTVLFNESLRYNIGFAVEVCPDEEVERAARAAYLHDFIASLPDGYDTVVGERGLKLSGGEKQRVAIARVVLKRPRIFLFDEATSSLDSHTERVIQENLREVSRGATTLTIAHRLSTVVHADQILVIDNARIAERGTHQTLLAANGTYAALWEKQQREPRPLSAAPL